MQSETNKISKFALPTLFAATFMGIIDTSIINVAAPSIQKVLPATFEQIQLIIAGYIIAYGVGLVMGGRLGDNYGRKKIFQLGLGLFVVMSLGCAIAPSASVLIILRILQGFSAALMLPQVLSTVQATLTGESRTKALGYYGATIGVASIAGQIVGGILISLNLFNLSWRWVFLVNVPIGLVALLISRRTVPSSVAGAVVKIDLFGSFLLGLAVGLLLYPVVIFSHAGWSVEVIVMLIASILIGFGFVSWERYLLRKGRVPLVPLSLFSVPKFRLGMLTVLAFYGGNAGFYLILAYFFQSTLHLTPFVSGLGYAPLGIGFMAASLLSSRITKKIGGRSQLLGAGMMAIAFVVLFLQLDHSPSAVNFIPALLVAGFGEGLIAVTLIGRVLGAISTSSAGLASGSLLTTTQIANVLSVAVTGSIYAGVLSSQHTSTLVATGVSFGWLFLLAILTFILVARLNKQKE